ncbi:hypothetical protein [Brasilonema sp. UFV-L1]|uniref:hypothetical protein n=1 Tax=Brasilonema sp. UFV-L1 TaxID=2234130 RepID=UPI00145E6D59|nr:hypothetical protein [Brasilonema sp. UFV-L1]NMG06255.1 hypothetical protein [Brasilonema sp. UFV-L1]
MPRIADYSVIQDAPFTLRVGGDIDRQIPFSLPNETHLGSRSILIFRTLNNATVSFRVEVNGSNQLNYTFGTSEVKTFHEVIDANVLQHGNNTINFVVTNGEITFADVILLTQFDI